MGWRSTTPRPQKLPEAHRSSYGPDADAKSQHFSAAHHRAACFFASCQALLPGSWSRRGAVRRWRPAARWGFAPGCEQLLAAGNTSGYNTFLGAGFVCQSTLTGHWNRVSAVRCVFGHALCCVCVCVCNRRRRLAPHTLSLSFSHITDIQTHTYTHTCTGGDARRQLELEACDGKSAEYAPYSPVAPRSQLRAIQ